MYERFSYGIGALGICVVVALQQIWKEKQLEYGENDKELDDYQQPQLSAYSHAAEAVDI
jgi:hypothetical protein